MQILVVDDETDVRDLFQQRFRRELRSGELSFSFAFSGEEAMVFLRAHHSEVLIILSDINMPGMSGLELLPQIKAARPALPVIMITAYGDAETRRRALEAGAQGLLTKPIDFEALKGEIESRVSLWEQGA